MTGDVVVAAQEIRLGLTHIGTCLLWGLLFNAVIRK